MEKPVAIITARGGSKRIPKKNIKDFLGCPIIKYSIEGAVQSGVFDKVIVSTDSQEIADVARSFGAEIPFMRSSKNSDDFATTSDVILEVLEQFAQSGHPYKQFCCIYPTAPFVTGKVLAASFKKFSESEADFSFPVCRFSYPPQRGLRIQNERLSMLYLEHKNTRSQDLEPVYHDAGQFYWGKSASLIKSRSLMVGEILPFIIDDLQCQDIDSMTDWKIAELKFRLLKEEGII